MSSRAALIFGSINMDLVARVPRLPAPGETILGHTFSTVPGGKGANQAVAVTRLGIPATLVGRVGNDSFGQELLAGLQASGVSIREVKLDSSVSSGVAMIAVDDESENHIIVIAGANGNVDQSDVDRLVANLSIAEALLLQLEIPLPTVVAAAQAAHAAGVKVILDPAPARSDLPVELYPLVDILTPNATEAEQLVGFPLRTLESAEQAATLLQQRGTPTIIIKLGAEGAFCLTPDDRFFVPAFAVDAIDTVAAGDAFNAGLAVALIEGLPMRDAVVWGAAAGALAATQPGAQSSLPDRETFNQFLAQQAQS